MTAGSNPQDADQAPDYVTGIADGNLATPVKLTDYLVGVGVMFRLPKRNRKKERAEAAKAEAAAAKSKVRIPVKLIATAMLPIVVAVGGYYAWTNFLASQPLPQEASGTWSTTDGRYAGRNFWLTESSVAFQNGATSDRFTVHPVKRVQTRQVADTTFIEIDYEKEGEAATLSLAYRDRPRPEMRLVNQRAVQWLRTGDAPVMR
mgnify:CR=1 FL=1